MFTVVANRASQMCGREAKSRNKRVHVGLCKHFQQNVDAQKLVIHAIFSERLLVYATLLEPCFAVFRTDTVVCLERPEHAHELSRTATSSFEHLLLQSLLIGTNYYD